MRNNPFNNRVARGDTLPPETEAVLIGYKEPLTKVKDGYGFEGTLAIDTSKQYVQCHLCGYFFRQLGIHVGKFHKIPVKEYRQQFGLAASTSLLAPLERGKHTQQWENMTSVEKLQHLVTLEKGRKKRLLNNKGGYKQKPLEIKNREGRCPAQLLDKIQSLANLLGRTPSRREFDEYYKKDYISSIKLTFGTWSEALKILGMTPRNGGRAPQYNAQMLLESITNFKKMYNRPPYYKDVRSGLMPAHSTYAKYFGSFTKAKEIEAKND